MANGHGIAWEHTIASADVIEVRGRYPRVIGRNAVLGSHGAGSTAWAVVLRTVDGAVGWGLTSGSPHAAPALVGRRVCDLIEPESGVLDDAVLWADIALHDLAGVILDIPVYELLGCRGSTQTAVYDASIYFDDLDPAERPAGIDSIVANVRAGWDAGYRAFKLKIGRGFRWMRSDEGLARDIAVVRAVRDAFPSARLLVDGNNGFSVDDCIHFLEGIHDVNLYWLEEPFHEHQAGLQRLRAWLDAHSPHTLIADGEYEPNVDECLTLARDGLLDVLLMDVVGYGITRWRRLYTMLEEPALRVSPHAWGDPLKTLYAAQMAAGLPRIKMIEGVPGTTEGVDTTGYTLADGVLQVPARPGFGVKLPDRMAAT